MTSIEEWILKKKPDRDPCGANVDSMNSASNHREKKITKKVMKNQEGKNYKRWILIEDYDIKYLKLILRISYTRVWTGMYL